MKKIIALAAFACCILTSSQAQQKDLVPARVGVQYGKKVDKAGAISVEKLAQTLESTSKFTGKVSGKVAQVCTKKGCFLTLQRSGEKEPLMVRFTDYSYLVPADLVGKNVILDGYAKVKESTKEITFIADGVLVVK